MKKYYILLIPLLIISTYVFALNEENSMYNSIEENFKTNNEIIKNIGSYIRSSVTSTGSQCSGTCDSNIKDIVFEVHGTKGCVVVLVETYESFPVYKTNSVNISYFLNTNDHSNTNSTMPCKG